MAAMVCELCGAAIAEADALFGMVSDPAARYPGFPDWDGQRLVVACSVAHLTELHERAEGPAARRLGDGG